MEPKCGWRWIVCDENGKPKTVWAWYTEARDSCRRNGKPGWSVKHEGTGRVFLTIEP